MSDVTSNTSGLSLPPIESTERKWCDMCGYGASFKCTGCESTWYCSESCQRAAWGNGHRDVCSGRSQKIAQDLDDDASSTESEDENEVIEQTQKVDFATIMREQGVEIIHQNDYSLLTPKELKELDDAGKTTLDVWKMRLKKTDKTYLERLGKGLGRSSVAPGVDIELHRIISRTHPVGFSTPPGEESYTVVVNGTIRKGTLLGEYTGQLKSEDSTKYTVSSVYSFDVNKYEEVTEVVEGKGGRQRTIKRDVPVRIPFSIDAKSKGNIFRFMNDPRGYTAVYNEEPNVKAELRWIDGKPRTLIFAAKRLTDGDELLIDYGEAFWVGKDKALMEAFANWVDENDAIKAVEMRQQMQDEINRLKEENRRLKNAAQTAPRQPKSESQPDVSPEEIERMRNEILELRGTIRRLQRTRSQTKKNHAERVSQLKKSNNLLSTNNVSLRTKVMELTNAKQELEMFFGALKDAVAPIGNALRPSIVARLKETIRNNEARIEQLKSDIGNISIPTSPGGQDEANLKIQALNLEVVKLEDNIRTIREYVDVPESDLSRFLTSAVIETFVRELQIRGNRICEIEISNLKTAMKDISAMLKTMATNVNEEAKAIDTLT